MDRHRCSLVMRPASRRSHRLAHGYFVAASRPSALRGQAPRFGSEKPFCRQMPGDRFLPAPRPLSSEMQLVDQPQYLGEELDGLSQKLYRSTQQRRCWFHLSCLDKRPVRPILAGFLILHRAQDYATFTSYAFGHNLPSAPVNQTRIYHMPTRCRGCDPYPF